MYPISPLYNDYLQRRSRDWLVKVNIAGVDYGANAIVDFVIENSVASEREFELGAAVLGKLTLRLKTADAIPPNARVMPYVALTGDQGPTEWLPLGEFYIDSRQQMRDVWEFVCYDKLVLADVVYVSQLTYPTSMQNVWDEICTRIGYTYDSSVVIDPSYQIQAGPAGYTCRQVLAYIASANGANLYIGKDGALRFRQFAGNDTPVMEMTKADYIRVKQTNPIKEYSRFIVVYRSEDDLYYELGSGDENHTLYIDNPFATQQIANDLYSRLNGFRYMPIEMDARGYPQIEVGDRIIFGQRAPEYDATWDTADVPWDDADWAWNGYEAGSGETIALNIKYTFRGGLKMTLDAPSKSEQESEFGIDGSLTATVNKLNKDAVKLGGSYYGVTITRTDGLTIEREDHASKVILNSDKLSFQAGGQDKIYFDPVSGKYKFSGTLEAADGNFTGTIQANQIDVSQGKITTAQIETLVVGTNVQIGTAQDAAGVTTIIGNTVTTSYVNALNVTAASVQAGWVYAGDIVGEQITGGTITGITIRTAASGERIEMSSNTLATYNSGNAKEGPAFEVGSIVGPNPGSFGTLNIYSGGIARMSMYATSNAWLTANLPFTVYSSSSLKLYGSTMRVGDNGSETTYTTNGSLNGNWYIGNINANNNGNFTIGNNSNSATVFGTWTWQSGSAIVFGSGSVWRINYSTSSTASSGGITPPAQVAGYIPVTINGTTRKIPYYAN